MHLTYSANMAYPLTNIDVDAVQLADLMLNGCDVTSYAVGQLPNIKRRVG